MMTERELAKIRDEYLISDSVRMRIPGPTESLSTSEDDEFVFFTYVLLQGVQLPLQPAVQKILAQIGYAPGQYNPNFLVALIGVIVGFSIVGEGEPSDEQFSYLYSVTKSKSADHGGWVQANSLKASERGYFVSVVPTSQKSWRSRRESPSGTPVRFHVPTTFQNAGSKLKPLIPTQLEIRQIDRVRLKVLVVDRVYPIFLSPYRMPILYSDRHQEDYRSREDERILQEVSHDGPIGEEEKSTAGSSPMPSAGVDPEDQTLADHLRQLNVESMPRGAAEAGSTPGRGQTTEAAASKVAGKRPITVDFEVEPVPKCGRQTKVPRAILVDEDDDTPTDPVTITCPSKTIQCANHMILGSQMELFEIDELPMRLLKEEAGRTFRLQASVLMDMWLCMKRAITTAERAKKVYEDGRAKVAEASKALQDHAHLLKDKQAAERQVKASEAKLAEIRAALEAALVVAKESEAAKGAVRVGLEESERAKAQRSMLPFGR
ncbi:unnamed protein product [Prunus armeniaca]